jgi:hypothetical protein
MPNEQGAQTAGVEKRNPADKDIRHPEDQDQPDEGPAMSGAGAGPSGNAMDHWETAMPNADATKPETMPNTASTPLPGETEDRIPV